MNTIDLEHLRGWMDRETTHHDELKLRHRQGRSGDLVFVRYDMKCSSTVRRR